MKTSRRQDARSNPKTHIKHMAKKIISANYRNRNSAYKWLIREEGQSPEEARACKRVTATNVKFQRSDDYEAGFGCKVVAVADEAEGHDYEVTRNEQGSALRFNGVHFEDHKGNAIQALEDLTLNDDGTIYGHV